MILNKISFIFLTLIFVTKNENAFTQNLTFSDLSYIIAHRIDESDTYLGKKGYEFLKYTEKDEDYSCPTTEWAFSRNISTDKADAFIARYCEDINEGFVWYQPKNKKAFEDFKSECLKLGFRFITKEYEPKVGAINFIYQNKNYKIQFASGLNRDNSNVYSITLHKL